MTMMTSIPVLTEEVSKKDARAASAFLLAFFNIERHREKLKHLGYQVGRTITEDPTKVSYAFPKEDGGVFFMELSREDPYDGRNAIINLMLEKIELIQRQRLLESAKKAITSSLRPAEVDMLRSLTPAELEQLLGQIRS